MKKVLRFFAGLFSKKQEEQPRVSAPSLSGGKRYYMNRKQHRAMRKSKGRTK